MKTIVKVQLPLYTNGLAPLALVYNQSRSIAFQLPVTKELKKKMAGEVKSFFYVDTENKLTEKAPWQSW